MADDNKRYSKLIKNSAIFAVANFGSYILRFIIVPFYTYYLTTEQYGIVDTVLTTINLLVPLVLLAMQEAVLRFSLSKDYTFDTIITNGLIVYCIGIVISLLGYFIFKQFAVFNGLWWSFYLLLIMQSLNNIILNFARGTEHSNIYMIGGLCYTAIMLGCNLIFLAVFCWGVRGYLFSMTLGYLISTVYVCFVLKIHNYIKLKSSTIDSLKTMLKYSFPLIPTAMMWWIMNVSDRYIITWKLGITSTGIYAISNKVPTILTMVYSIFQQAWQISAINENNSKDRDLFYKDVFDKFFRILFLAASFLIIIIRPLIITVVEESYYSSWMYAPTLVIAAVFSSMGGFLGINFAVTGKTIGSLTTSLIGALTNIILNIILIPVLGLHGAALTTFIGYYIVWIVRATKVTGGIKIQQNYKMIHFQLSLVIIQCIIILIDLKYQYIIQVLIFGIIAILNRKILLEIISIGKLTMINIIQKS